jgi:hypothetical protein
MHLEAQVYAILINIGVICMERLYYMAVTNKKETDADKGNQ